MVYRYENEHPITNQSKLDVCRFAERDFLAKSSESKYFVDDTDGIYLALWKDYDTSDEEYQFVSFESLGSSATAPSSREGMTMEKNCHQTALIRAIDDLPTRAVYNNDPGCVRYDFKDGRLPNRVRVFDDPCRAMVTDDVKELMRYIVLRTMFLYEQENRHASLFTLQLMTRDGTLRRNSRNHHVYASFNPLASNAFNLGMQPDDSGMGKLFTDLDKWLRTVTHELNRTWHEETIC